MTTIAFRDGTLAADSLTTASGLRDSPSQKIWRHGRLLIGGAGSSALCHKFCQWVRQGMKGKSPIEQEGGGANGFVITPEGQIIVWGDHGPWQVDRPYYALGSGSTVAMGAMQCGASAEQAVEAAIALDIYSGGPVRVLKQEA